MVILKYFSLCLFISILYSIKWPYPSYMVAKLLNTIELSSFLRNAFIHLDGNARDACSVKAYHRTEKRQYLKRFCVNGH